jgi:hypothetical protein
VDKNPSFSANAKHEKGGHAARLSHSEMFGITKSA